MIRPQRIQLALAAVPGLAYLAISAAIIAAMACKVGTKYSFNVNEGWNAFWADAAWSGAGLYPPVSDLKLNNYPPIWFYLTGGIGRLVGDNIRAGRAIAATALLLNGAVVSLIARELVGADKASWLAGAAFVAIFGLFYQDYAAANDPQILANLLMMIALLLVVRSIGETRPLAFHACVVFLMLVAGLTKHSDVTVPLSVALFFLLSRGPRAFLGFVGLSIVGVAIASAGLYLAYGKSIFSSVLLSRPYNAGVAWAQTKDQLAHYGLLLAVIPFLAFLSGDKARLALIYAAVALIQGAVLSGGYRVDVNVFFDLLFCVSIGLGVMGTAVTQFIRKPGPSSGLRWAATACWMAIALLPPLIAVRSASGQIGDAFDAVADASSYEADLRYIRSTPPGKIICEDLALCYWAGQPFNLDLNNLRTIVWSAPELEDRVVAQIGSCKFSLIELNDDPDEPTEAQISDRIRESIELHYQQVRETAFAIYWRPRCG